MTTIGCMDCSLKTVFDLFIHEGLHATNPKLLDSVDTVCEDKERNNGLSKKGAVFVVRKKSDFRDSGVRGFIVTSKETLVAQSDYLSHFTPNIYRRFGYTDDSRKKIKGFEEKNLLQINSFGIDIDTYRYSVNELLLACIDDSIGEPTLILKTDRGYQVFFVLSTPIYISNKKNYLSLKVAKRIADNLKRSLVAVESDMNCNDFGFFRMPNRHNILWFNKESTYEPAQLIAWSQRQDDDLDRYLYVISKKTGQDSLLQSDWFKQLISVTDIKGEKGQIGRNNYLFTLALVCYQDGKSKDYAYDLLDEFNTKMNFPLKFQDVMMVLESAYSGRYFGAKKEYVEQLLDLYSLTKGDVPICFGKKVWYKHKKKREERKNSHVYEWEKDIIDWIAAEKTISEPFIWRTQKELCEEIGISSSTLNYLLKHSKKLLKKVSGKGRNAKTGWTTVEQYLAYIIWMKNEKGQQFSEFIKQLVEKELGLMESVAGHPFLCRVIKQHYIRKNKQLSLFNLKTG